MPCPYKGWERIMEPIEAAIMRTILYADVFHFPLSLTEIHRFLIHDEGTPLALVEEKLENCRHLLYEDAGYYCLKNRQEILITRQERERHSLALWQSAFRYGRWFAAIPFVRMVALTGALAVRNPASLRDDFDYMLVTKSGRVWTARLLAVVLVRVVRLMGRELCPNYVLAEEQLLQARQDIFIAHELAQMQPIHGLALYQQMLDINGWAKDYLPNIEAYKNRQGSVSPIKRILEWILAGRFGDWLENWEFSRKAEKFSAEIDDHSSAQIDENQAKGHFKDNGHPILEQYHARLREYGLIEEAIAVVGD
jgi:hypothetical protein